MSRPWHMVGIACGILAAQAPAAELVTDEATRLEALSAIFPKMSIHWMPRKKIDHSQGFAGRLSPLYFPDAFKDEKVYGVVGDINITMDGCAPGENLSRKREVRFQFFHVRDALFLLALQYRFSNAAALKICESVSRAFLLSRGDSAWTVNAEAKPFFGHGDISSIVFADLNGDGVEEFIIEEDERLLDWFMTSSVWIFDISLGRFDVLTGTASRLYSREGKSRAPKESLYTTVLDLESTRAEKAKRVCFITSAFAEDGVWFTPPRITHPCWQPEGLGRR